MNKIKNSLMGAFIGDALGYPFEFSRRGEVNYNDDYEPIRLNSIKGPWSDDSSMILATMDSLTQLGFFNANDIMNKFVEWYNSNKYNPINEFIDCGYTVQQAILNYQVSGILGVEYNNARSGNGSLMRILPVVIFEHCGKCSREDILNCGKLTHNTFECNSILLEYAQWWNYIYNNGKIPEDYVGDIPASSGYVVHTWDSVRYCLTESGSFEECMRKAIELGGDTDTIASIAGGLAGLIWDIPEKFRKGIYNKKYLENMIDNFCKVCQGG